MLELYGATVLEHRDYVLALALAFALLFAFALAFAFAFPTAFTAFAPLPAATSLVGSPPQSRRDISKALISASAQRSMRFYDKNSAFQGSHPVIEGTQRSFCACEKRQLEVVSILCRR